MNPNKLIGAFAIVIAPVVLATEAANKVKEKIENRRSR
jgi:hypothetical protein